MSCAWAQSRWASRCSPAAREELGGQLRARNARELGAQEGDRVLALAGVEIGDDERLAQRVVAGAVLGHAALQPLERILAAVDRVELVRDAHVARRRREVVRQLAHEAVDVAERARERLAHRAQRQADVRERGLRVGRHRVELARQDRVERGKPVVAEQIAVALGRVLHPVALGLLGQLDQPGCERLGPGRHGMAGGQVQLAHLDPQRIHVGIGGAELAERLVDAEDRVLGQRDTRRMRGAHELVQLGERLVDPRGEARGAAPGGLTRRLRDRGQALADRDGVHRADGEGDLDIEPVARRPGAELVVGHRRQASTLAPRDDRIIFGACSDFPTAMEAP